MKIVFITSSYYPYFSAIGKCIYNLVNEIKKDHEIIVISNMTTLNMPHEDVFEGHKIIRVRTDSMKKRDQILELNQESNLLRSVMDRIKLLLLRGAGYFDIIMSKSTIQKSLVSEYYKALSTIKEVDLIIPTCYPFEAIYAAQKYRKCCNNNVKIIPFLFDKYSESPTLHRNMINKMWKYKRHLTLEEQMIQDSEKVLYVDSWIDHMKKHFSNYNGKLIHVEHPLILEYSPGGSIKNLDDSSNFIDVVYTGVLDRKVRPPFETLKIMSRIIEKDNRFRFHFYVLGNCKNELDEYQMKYPQNIFNHGQVKSDVALSEIMKSNILISIGNTDISLIPSKIFEYMSCGKPIIHFYNSEDDRIISMLNDYGLGYCTKQYGNVSEYEIDSIIRFCDINSSIGKSFKDVKEIFYKATPQFITEKILDSIS